jgi:hypothetical protein
MVRHVQHPRCGLCCMPSFLLNMPTRAVPLAVTLAVATALTTFTQPPRLLLLLLLLLFPGSAASQVFIGCFKDPGPAGLPDLLFRGGSSAAECGAWARRAGNRVYGLVGAGSSRECRAGWDSAAAMVGGVAGSGCGAPCKEGPGRCGGAGSVGLWRTNRKSR